MIEFRQKGNFSRLNGFFERTKEIFKHGELDKYGRAGVEALESATPRDTGKTAASWSYEIIHREGSASIEFHNSNLTEIGYPIAILIQYGHGTKNGGYVEGIDYINPALKPVFEYMANEAYRDVKKA